MRVNTRYINSTRGTSSFLFIFTVKIIYLIGGLHVYVSVTVIIHQSVLFGNYIGLQFSYTYAKLRFSSIFHMCPKDRSNIITVFDCTLLAIGHWKSRRTRGRGGGGAVE